MPINFDDLRLCPFCLCKPKFSFNGIMEEINNPDLYVFYCEDHPDFKITGKNNWNDYSILVNYPLCLLNRNERLVRENEMFEKHCGDFSQRELAMANMKFKIADEIFSKSYDEICELNLRRKNG